MIREKSCGAAVFVRRGDKIMYLVETMRQGHHSLCKGHVEGSETEHETARREILEETALSVRFIDGFRETISYSPYAGCVKEVVFFLAEAGDENTVAQMSEVSSIRFLPLEEALAELTYEDDRRVLRAADAFLKAPPEDGGDLRG